MGPQALSKEFYLTWVRDLAKLDGLVSGMELIGPRVRARALKPRRAEFEHMLASIETVANLLRRRVYTVAPSVSKKEIDQLIAEMERVAANARKVLDQPRRPV